MNAGTWNCKELGGSTEALSLLLKIRDAYVASRRAKGVDASRDLTTRAAFGLIGSSGLKCLSKRGILHIRAGQSISGA